MITIVIAKGVQQEDVRDYINVNKMEERVTSLKERIKEMNRIVRGSKYVDSLNRTNS